MFSSGNEVGTLAVWVGEGGWDCEGVRRGAWAARRLARCPPPPPPLFSIGTGARQFVPPLPRQREAPRSMMSTRLRGPEKPAAGPDLDLANVNKPQHHTFRYRSVHLPRLGWSISKTFLPAPDGWPNIHDHHALLLELWKEDAVGGVVHPMQDNGHSS